MGRVLTNNTSFAFAREATETAGSRGIGFLPGEDPGDGGGALAGTPSWKTLEPNEISRFGASITTVARSPIRPQRGRQKGTISDLDSAVEIGADITVDSFLDLAEGFAFSTFSNLDLVFQAADAETTGDSYAVPSLSVAQAAKLQSDANGDTLLFASGYLLAANNGLKTLDTAAGSTDIALSVEENLADETAPDNARLEIAGMRLADGEMDLTITAAVDGVCLSVNLSRLFGEHVLGISLLASGDREDFADSLPGYVLVNLNGQLKLSDNWQLNGRIENLLDTDYQTAAPYRMPEISGFLELKYRWH
jgi:outer membrane receptor protein involved in Fe transport